MRFFCGIILLFSLVSAGEAQFDYSNYQGPKLLCLRVWEIVDASDSVDSDVVGELASYVSQIGGSRGANERCRPFAEPGGGRLAVTDWEFSYELFPAGGSPRVERVGEPGKSDYGLAFDKTSEILQQLKEEQGDTARADDKEWIDRSRRFLNLIIVVGDFFHQAGGFSGSTRAEVQRKYQELIQASSGVDDTMVLFVAIARNKAVRALDDDPDYRALYEIRPTELLAFMSTSAAGSVVKNVNISFLDGKTSFRFIRPTIGRIIIEFLEPVFLNIQFDCKEEGALCYRNAALQSRFQNFDVVSFLALSRLAAKVPSESVELEVPFNESQSGVGCRGTRIGMSRGRGPLPRARRIEGEFRWPSEPCTISGYSRYQLEMSTLGAIFEPPWSSAATLPDSGLWPGPWSASVIGIKLGPWSTSVLDMLVPQRLRLSDWLPLVYKPRAIEERAVILIDGEMLLFRPTSFEQKAGEIGFFSEDGARIAGYIYDKDGRGPGMSASAVRYLVDIDDRARLKGREYVYLGIKSGEVWSYKALKLQRFASWRYRLITEVAPWVLGLSICLLLLKWLAQGWELTWRLVEIWFPALFTFPLLFSEPWFSIRETCTRMNPIEFWSSLSLVGPPDCFLFVFFGVLLFTSLRVIIRPVVCGGGEGFGGETEGSRSSRVGKARISGRTLHWRHDEDVIAYLIPGLLLAPILLLLVFQLQMYVIDLDYLMIAEPNLIPLSGDIWVHFRGQVKMELDKVHLAGLILSGCGESMTRALDGIQNLDELATLDPGVWYQFLRKYNALVNWLGAFFFYLLVIFWRSYEFRSGKRECIWAFWLLVAGFLALIVAIKPVWTLGNSGGLIVLILSGLAVLALFFWPEERFIQVGIAAGLPLAVGLVLLLYRGLFPELCWLVIMICVLLIFFLLISIALMNKFKCRCFRWFLAILAFFCFAKLAWDWAARGGELVLVKPAAMSACRDFEVGKQP